MSLSKKVWKKVRNRTSRTMCDMGLLLGSSELSVRLRSFGRPHGTRNCVLRDSTGHIVEFGEAAQQLRGRISDESAVDSPFRQGRVENLDACKELLERAIRRSRHGVIMGPRVLIGTVSNLSRLEKRTVKEVAKAAGARSSKLVETAVLCVLGAGRDPSGPRGHLVLDLGAGCGEIALVASGKVQQSRVVSDFGNRLDQVIADALREELSVIVSLEEAERLKKELAGAFYPESPTTDKAYGCDVETGLPCEREVSAELVSRAIQPLLIELAEDIRSIVKTLPSGWVQDISEDGIILAGGVARIPELSRYIQDFTRLPVKTNERPELMVQQGMDLLLKDPDKRNAVFYADKKPEARRRRFGSGSSERLAGLVALALLLVASYFPTEKVNLGDIWSGWSRSMVSAMSMLDAPDEETISSRYQNTIAEQERKLNLLSTELAKVRQVSKLKSAPPAWAKKDGLVGRVVARAPGSWNEKFVINLGKADGVKPGMTVTTDQGLVGSVLSVKETVSHVLLLSGDDEKFGGVIARTGSKGVVEPVAANRLALHYVDPNDGVKPGDVVKTSGLDSKYPPGVPVGKVLSVKPMEGEPYLVAEIETSADFDETDSVLLLAGRI